MDNKTFKEEVVGSIAFLCGVIIVLILSGMGNPNALGENLYWALAAIVFSISAATIGGILYTALTIWEKRAPHSFTTAKRKTIIKTTRFMENLLTEKN